MASDKIEWAKVQKLAELYRKSPAALKTPVDGKIETLNGIRFTKKCLENLLNQTGKEIEEIFVMPIVRPEDEKKPTADQYFSFALVGIDDQNNLVTELAYEFGGKCPSDCAQNFKDAMGLSSSQ